MTSRRKILKSIAGLSVGLNFGFKGLACNTCFEKAPIPLDIDIKTLPPGPKSKALINRMKRSIGKTNYTGLYGVSASKGDGVYLVDLDENVYIDCLAAASTNILGYDNHKVAEAYYQAANSIPNTAFGYTPNPEAVELAEKLISITPGEYEKKVLLGVSGSDACGTAIEAARKYTGKMGVLSFNYAYHGSTGLSQQASGFENLKDGIYRQSPDFIKVGFPRTLKERDQILKEVEAVIKKGTIGAVIAEPIQGDAGIIMPSKGFFPRLMDLLQKHNILLIDDEIQSGMGRTGKWWAIEHEDVIPDMVVAGKGLSAGYAPISATIGRKDIIDSLNTAQQIFTYTGHGPSAAAAKKVISLIQKKKLINNAHEVGSYLLSGLKQMTTKYPEIFTEARGLGLMIGLEVNTNKIKLANKIFAYRCLEKGIYFGYFGPGQKVIRIEPPLVLSMKEADKILSVVQETAGEMINNKIPEETVAKVKKYALGW